jgi:hypothetical protein
MTDFFRVLFLEGLAPTSEGFTHDYFARVFWMLVICLLLVFLVTLVLLAFTVGTHLKT